MWLPRELEQLGAASGTKVRRVFKIEEALEDADVVLALRVQNERLYEPSISLNDYILLYQLSADRLRRAKADAIVLHPGPLNRGIEITPEVADGPQSCVLEQVTNGIAVRMALLFQLAAGDAEPEALPTGDAAAQAGASKTDQPRNRRATDRQPDNKSDANTDAKEVKDPSHASH
jgi:aspartate carbamoyltransferase catalytic subunit